jgi:hypothetical protein
MAPLRKNPKIVSREEHAVIQEKCKVRPPEDYSVVLQKGKGFWNKSIHVFTRQPTAKELQDFDEQASRLKFKGQKAEMEGAPILAAANLYNRLIERAYDVLVGLESHDNLTSEQARLVVPPLVKREAIREFTAEVYSASRMEEAEGVESGSGKDDEDDDLEAHT